MVFVLLLLVFLLLYFDNLTSVAVGGGGDRGVFQFILIAFILFLLVWGGLKAIRRKQLFLPKLLISMLAISAVLFFKSRFSIANSPYQELRFTYSVAWIIIVASTTNIFADISIRDRRIFLFGMGVLFLFSVYNAFNSYNYLLLEKDSTVIPSIYLSVMFLPWLLLLYDMHRGFSLFLLFVLLVITLLSAKRGAILCVAVALPVYLITKYSQKGKRFPLGPLFAIFVFVAGLFVLVDTKLGGSLSSRFELTSLTDGSGRRDIYLQSWNAIVQMSEPRVLLFGFPYDSSTVTSFGGHNDWFTFLILNGVIGLTAFACFYIRLFKIRDRLSSVLRPIFTSLIFVMLLQSLYSTSYNPTLHPLFAMMFIGYAEASLQPSSNASHK